MMTLLTSSILLCTIFYFSESLEENGENVFKRTRLVNVQEKYPSSWMNDWQCEEDFNAITCDRIRNGLNHIDYVYVYTEELVCSDGWTTVLPTDRGCTKNCLPGYYGQNCALACRCLYGSSCDSVDGKCDCLEGWKGHDCTTRCDLGEYGRNCQSTALICENGGVNHPLFGDCLCPGSYRGDRCQEGCNPAYDQDCALNCELCTSLNADVCDYIFGSCRCHPGWRGFYCTEPCAPGFQGSFCGESCCSGHGFCDEPNNRCLCLDGYTGQNCSEKCPNGFFGRDCIQKCVCPFCDHITGSCETCPTGYQGDGCKGTCNLEQWGPNCNSSCTCANDATCDVFTGKCKETSTKKYEDSEEQDSMDVDPSSESEFESKSEPPDDSDESTISIVILGVSNLCGILAIVSFIGILACVCSKRRDRKKTYRENPPEPKLITTISKQIEEPPEDNPNHLGNQGNIADPPNDPNNVYDEINPIPGPEENGYMALRPGARING